MQKLNILNLSIVVASLLISSASFALAIHTYKNPKIVYAKGEDGKDGIDGKDGTNGLDGVDGQNGEKGETGPAGPKGDKGDQGYTGPKGDKGEDGSSFLTGEGVPDSSLGKEGDTYLDTSSEEYNLYKKVNGSWTKIGQLKDSPTTIDEDDDPITQSDETEYTIVVDENIDSLKGSITSDKSQATPGETITFTISEISSYTINTIEIKDLSTSTLLTTLSTDNLPTNADGNKSITYIMPSQNILVSITFTESTI